MTRRTRWIAALSLAAAVVILGWIGHSLLWSTCMAYDDEGYVLYSLRAYAEHGHLYSAVYSQYGPFFFVLCGAMRHLGLAFTNIGAREATLACWLGSAVFCAALTWRAAPRRVVAVLAVLVGVFIHLHVMSAEPSHPGGFIALIVAMAAWCAAETELPPALRAAAIGAMIAMLALTKINVGALLFLGMAGWWLLCASPFSSSTWSGAVALGWAAVSFGLMRPLLSQSWVQMFAVVVSMAGGALVIVLPRPFTASVRVRAVAAAALGAAIVTIVTLGLVLANGTTWRDVLEGTVLGPLHHPTVYHLSLTWRSGTLPLAVLSLGAAVTFPRLPHAWRLPVLAAARVAAVLGYVAALAMLVPVSLSAWVTCFGLTTAWIFVAPWRENDPTWRTRALLAFLLITQSLHAYPVAGSQLNWGTFLWVPLAVLGLLDLAPVIVTRSVGRAVAAGSTLFLVGMTARVAYVAQERERGSDQLNLPGAETLRLPEEYTTAIRTMARNAQVHGDVLFTLPGMMSFNAWTNVPPPTIANATHWFNLLSEGQQLAIKDRLAASPHSVIIVQRFVYDLLQQQQFLHGGVLLDWILANYTVAFRVGTYEFWVRRGREIKPTNAASLYASRDTNESGYRLSVDAVLTRAATIDRLELRQFNDDASTELVAWTARNAVIQLHSPANGTAANHADAPARLPVAATGRVQLDIYTSQFPAHLDRSRAVIYLVDSTGARVGEARFIDVVPVDVRPGAG